MQTKELDALERDAKDCNKRLNALEVSLERCLEVADKNGAMMRKQLFRLNKNSSHLAAKLNLLEEDATEQSKMQQNLMNVVVQTHQQMRTEKKQIESVITARSKSPVVAPRKLNFNPIYD